MKKIFMLVLVTLIVTGIGFARKITVNSPNGGEVWKKGDVKTIAWNSSGLTNLVKITLWKNGSFVGVIAKNQAKNGTYPWKVGKYRDGTAGCAKDYKINVREQGGPSFKTQDDSNGYFEISECFPDLGYLIEKFREVDWKYIIIDSHGPGPVSLDFSKYVNVLERCNFNKPISVGLFNGRRVVKNLGTFTPTFRRGRANFNSMRNLKLYFTNEEKELINGNIKNYSFVIMSGEKILDSKPIKLSKNTSKDQRINTQRMRLAYNPKVSIKAVRMYNNSLCCPDLAVVDIKFNIVKRYNQYEGRVRITGIVKNISNKDYISHPNQQYIELKTESTTIKRIKFKDLKAGKTILITYELDWNTGSTSSREFSQHYTVTILYDPDIGSDSLITNNDSNSNNDKMTKDSSLINKLF